MDTMEGAGIRQMGIDPGMVAGIFNRDAHGLAVDMLRHEPGMRLDAHVLDDPLDGACVEVTGPGLDGRCVQLTPDGDGFMARLWGVDANTPLDAEPFDGTDAPGLAHLLAAVSYGWAVNGPRP